MKGDLLTPDEPLFAVVRRRAATGEVESLRWFLDSARRWALGEFARRLKNEAAEWREEPDRIEQRCKDARGFQAAILYGSNLQAKLTDVVVGRVGKETNEDFIRVQIADGSYVSAVCRVVDIFRLPGTWQVSPWPLEFKSAVNGMPEPAFVPGGGHLPVVKTPRVDGGVTVNNRVICPICQGQTGAPTDPPCGMCSNTGLMPLPAIGDVGLDDDDKVLVWDGYGWAEVVSVSDSASANGSHVTRTYSVIHHGTSSVPRSSKVHATYHRSAPPSAPDIPPEVEYSVGSSAVGP